MNNPVVALRIDNNPILIQSTCIADVVFNLKKNGHSVERVMTIPPKRFEVLVHIAKKNSEIAGLIGTSERNIEKHIEQLLNQFECNTRTAVAIKAARLGVEFFL